MKIYLIGYMASGKSTAGKELAELLKCSFVDVDEYVEKQQGKAISLIFEERGEEYFRHIEKVALREISQLYKNCVIATGGGTSCFYSNIDFMNIDGVTVYLRLEVATLVARLLNDHTQRPLISGKSKTDLNDYILNALNLRRKFYEKSHIVLDVDDYSSHEVATMIREIVMQHK